MQRMCEQVGAELKIIDIESEFLQDVLFDPKHGYGKNFNPCIDCHKNVHRCKESYGCRGCIIFDKR